jgi:hypothetical protein
MDETIPKLPFLPEAYHYAIAAVAARSAQLDHLIPIMVFGLLSPGKPHTVRFLVNQFPKDRLVGLLQAALHDQFPGEAERIDGVISEIGRLRKERNRILHWLWDKSDTPDIATLTRMPIFGESQVEEKTAAEVQAVADGLLAAMNELTGWANRQTEQILASVKAMEAMNTIGTGLLAAFAEP